MMPLLAAPLASFLIWKILLGLLRGEIRSWRTLLRRNDAPLGYAFTILWEGAAAALLLAICCYAIHQLATG